eukprot:COSAG01_NODE_1708_length_9425_cov_5.499893_14_plen_49_part_00
MKASNKGLGVALRPRLRQTERSAVLSNLYSQNIELGALVTCAYHTSMS